MNRLSKCLSVLSGVFAGALLLTTTANAAVHGMIVDFEGHGYILASEVGVTWDEARAIAASQTMELPDGTVLKGHLLTVNSQAEQDFVSAMFLTENFRKLWIGGYQFFSNVGPGPISAAEPDGNWAWVTGEEIGNIATEWSYNFMQAGQPGDDNNPVTGIPPNNEYNPVNREDALQMLINNGTGIPVGTGNDRWGDFNRGDIDGRVEYFVIEFDEIGDQFITSSELPRIVSSSVWSSSANFTPGWETIDFPEKGWLPAFAPYPAGPGATPPTNLIPGTQAEAMWHCGIDNTLCPGITGMDGPIRAFFRFTFYLDLPAGSRPLVATANISVDDDYDLYVNGELILENHNGGFADLVESVEFSSSLRNGKNVIAIEAVDGSWDDPRPRLYERVIFDATILRQPDLLIVSGTGNASEDGDVLHYDGRSGVLIGEFGDIGCIPIDLVYGPDGKLYVADLDHPFGGCLATNIVGRFDGRIGLDEIDDDPYADFIPLSDPRFSPLGPGGLAFGPDDNLYVSDPADGTVYRYQGPFPPGFGGSIPGSFIDAYVTPISVFTETRNLLFGPDNNLYVIQRGAFAGISRYQGPFGDDPGSLIDRYTLAPNGLSGPVDFAFGPDKRLYIADAGRVLRVNFFGSNFDTFVANAPGARALNFGPDGDLYVTTFELPDNVYEVRRFDGRSGAPRPLFVRGPRLGPFVFSAIPDFAADLGDFNDDGCVDRLDLTEELLPAIFGGSTDPRFDLNGDGMLNIADARKLVLLFSRPLGALCS